MVGVGMMSQYFIDIVIIVLYLFYKHLTYSKKKRSKQEKTKQKNFYFIPPYYECNAFSKQALRLRRHHRNIKTLK